MDKKTDAAPGAEAEEGPQGYYHSQKDRIFVRAVQGEYNLTHELERLRAMPRVRRAREIQFVDGPQAYSRHYVEPKDGITQLFHIHLEEYGPGGKSQKHGHVNEAAFYILDGEGYEIHDDVRYDWKAGDVAIVHNNCVHQHFNASDTKPARALVLKTKPMFVFMNMLFQKTVEPRETEPAPGRRGLRGARGGGRSEPPRGGLLMAWGESKAWIDGDREPAALPGPARRRRDRARAQRAAQEDRAPARDAVGDVAPGAAEAPDQRGDEHPDGDGRRLHADHPARLALGQAPAPGRGMPLRAGGARLRPAPGLRRRDHRRATSGSRRTRSSGSSTRRAT